MSAAPSASRRVGAPPFDFISLALVAAMFVALFGAQAAGAGVWVALVARAAIFAIAALSLSFVLGQGGLVSFGHAAPMGMGAYASLALGQFDVTDLGLVAAFAFAASTLFCATTGAIALRTRGVYFIMITLAFAQMAFFTVSSMSALGGDDGMALPSRSTLFGTPVFKTDFSLALCALALLAASLLALQRIARSRFGVVLRACKENELRLAALGFAAGPYRLVAYAVSGGLAGLSGAFLANLTEFVSPSYMNWHRSGELIIMVVLGGTSRLSGAVLGAVALVLIEEGLGHFTEYWRLGLGLMIVATVLLRGQIIGKLIAGLRNG